MIKSSVIGKAAAVALASFLAVGCATNNNSGSVYESRQGSTLQKISYGTLMAVRDVQLQGEIGAGGMAAGAIMGGALGSQLGNGSGNIAGAVVGAIAGAAVGKAAEMASERKPAIELEVKLDNGEIVAVVQEKDGQVFVVGQTVRLVQVGREVKVSVKP